MSELENLKGMKLPGIQPDGNFPSKHPQKIFQNGKAVINPAWSKDQAILRSQAKDISYIQRKDILRDAAKHESKMYNPEKQKPIKMPTSNSKPSFTIPKGIKLPGYLGLPFMFNDFLDFYNQQQAPTTLPDGTPLEANVNPTRGFSNLANLNLS